MNGQDKDQKDWEDYLSGNSELSHHYRRESGERAPAHLDSMILKTARDSVRRKPRVFGPFSGSWLIPASLAAILIITVTVVPLMQDSLVTPEPAFVPSPVQTEAARDKVAASKPSSPASKPAPTIMNAPASRQQALEAMQAREQERRQEEARLKKKSMETARRQEASKLERKAIVRAPTDSKRSVTSGAAEENAVAGFAKTRPELARNIKSAEDWLKEIKKLLEQNKKSEADASFKEFRKHYPDYPAEKMLGPEYRHR